MANVEEKIKGIDKELSKLHKKEGEIKAEIDMLEKEKLKNLSKKHKNVYRILCKPNRRNNRTHYIGAFSTSKKAQSFIPRNGRSRDGDSGCIWTYSVVKVKATDDFLGSLDDDPPEYFPYTGW